MFKRATLAALFFTMLDQASKLLVAHSFYEGEARTVVPGFLNVCYVLNPGASWGMFAGWRWPLVAFSFAALAALFFWREKIFPPGQPLATLTCALFLGGITGNLVDRLRSGAVIDFIDVHWRNHHFPVFNVADICISTGLVIYLAGQFIAERRLKAAAHTSVEDP